MKIGNYELNENTRFYTSFDGEKLITCGAGNDIPLCAIWINGKPKSYDMIDDNLLPCTFDGFYDLFIDSQASE